VSVFEEPMKKSLEFWVNGEHVELEIEPQRTLLEVLREDLGLTGTKEGCGLGACGACTVNVDGSPMLSCLLLAMEVRNRSITTIEGLMRDGKPDPLQLAFVNHGAIQCGFCTPGAIISAKALLGRNPEPSRTEIKEALSGNLCRCTGYKKIIDAVASVKER
jgi:aerobic-type carbon monoxide dehydrogenase small subunit (CoxS/CutS family)